MLNPEVLDRLAGAGQVVEVAALHREPKLLVDPLLLALDALRRRRATGAFVALGTGVRSLPLRFVGHGPRLTTPHVVR